MSSPGLWEGLKEEQKAVVQLLLGQNDLTTGQDFLRQRLDQLIRSLAFDLDLNTPQFIEQQTTNAPHGSSPWLTYAHRQAQLIGRDHDLQQLRGFFEQEAMFGWWLITGAGGIGKSRLALEALIQHQATWEVGFLTKAKLDKPDALDQWLPVAPTIVVIDYAAEKSEAIGNWLDHLLKHQDDFDFPVRLLLLEREYRQQTWWEKLMPATTAGNRRQQALYQQPHELRLLARNEQHQALQSFLHTLHCNIPLPEADDTFWTVLHELSSHGRPLFIGMVAITITSHGLNRIRHWDQVELLNYVLRHEQEAWRRQIAAQELTPHQNNLFDLLALSSITAGFDGINEDSLFQTLNQSALFPNEQILERALKLLPTLSGNPAGYLQPDIFAEYFLLTHWPDHNGKLSRTAKKHLLAASQLALNNTLACIARCAVDYPHDTVAWQWWNYLHENAAIEASPLNELVFGIIGQLRLQGKYRVALQYWLPKLLSDSKDLKSRARAINLAGLLNDHLGNYDIALQSYEESLVIWQEISNKSGEGTTLNNISQIFKVRGDYETALDYLKKSLTIQQEIGDKYGEGTTLNNISQIYDARGDYETALDYLKKSLTIQQEIGDKSGEGTTLNNISQIYHARGDYETALDYLKKSLTIRQEIGDKSGEGATLNNISQIFKVRGDYETALDYLKKSLTIQQEIGNKSGEGTTLNNISQIFKVRGDYETALDYLKKSLAIQQEIGDKYGEGTTLNNISQIFKVRGDYETALDYLKKSLAIQQEIGDKYGEGTT
ncbi:MAG: ATP-binding protein, partial [Nitrosomonas oligotropha]